ncbi:hypothetical protein M758_2G075700 [Ceratodon purpureus]|nr:hypothetical protein M758_2G075700 [Ceratodon purpureus]
MSLPEMEGTSVESTLLHLDPIGRLTEEQTPSINLSSLLDEYRVNSIFSTNDQHDRDTIDLKQISEQVAALVEEPHKVENLLDAFVDPHLAAEVCGCVDHDCDDPAELKRVLEEDHISEGFEILDKVEDLHNKYALATRKTRVLELSLWDLTEKIKLLESKIILQEQQILDAQNRQEEQDALLLSPMRSIYLRHFHDQVREGICEKLAATPLHARHQRALRLRVYEKAIDHRYGEDQIFDNNLWSFMQETHGISPQFFNKTTMWNEFVDDLLKDEELVALLGLSPASILITRFGRPTEQQEQSKAETTGALRNKHIFAELVTRQDDEQRPTYTELYKFLFNAEPETLNFKAIISSPREEDPVK